MPQRAQHARGQSTPHVSWTLVQRPAPSIHFSSALIVLLLAVAAFGLVVGFGVSALIM